MIGNYYTHTEFDTYMTKKFGVALIGCGQFGSKRAKAVHSSNQHAQLIGVFDPDHARAQELAGRYQTTCFPSLESLLADSAVDGVIISSPNYLHASQSIAALAQQKHVLCEKPAGISTVNFNDLSATIKGVELQKNWQYGYNHRFFDPVTQLKEWLDQTAIGAVQTIEMTIASGRNEATSTWFSDPQQSGGGTLIDNGHHLFDLLLWLLPGQWQVVTAATELLPKFQVESLAEVSLVQNSIKAHIVSKWQASQHYLSIVVIGEKGTITITDETAKLDSSSNTQLQYPIVPGSAVQAEISDWLYNSLHQPKLNALQNLESATIIYDLITTAYTFSTHDSC